MNDKLFEQMISYKGLFMRSFFECNDCGFVFTTLGQANHNIDGGCPACGEYDCDYASKGARDKFIQGVKDELEVFEKELANE